MIRAARRIGPSPQAQGRGVAVNDVDPFFVLCRAEHLPVFVVSGV